MVGLTMPYLRQRPKIAANGRVAVKLTPPQRDQLIATGALTRALGHFLHHAPVARGKLEVRLRAEEVDALIAAAIKIPADGAAPKRAVDIFIRYLEDRSDRFEPEPEE